MDGTEMLENTDWHGEHIEAWKVHLEDGVELDLKERLRRWAMVMKEAKRLGLKRDARLEQIKRENIRKLTDIEKSEEIIELIKNI